MSIEISDVLGAWAEGDDTVSADEQVDVVTGPLHIRAVYTSMAEAAGAVPASDALVSFWDVVGSTSTFLFDVYLPQASALASMILPEDGYIRCEGDLKVSCDNANGAEVFRITVLFTGGEEA